MIDNQTENQLRQQLEALRKELLSLQAVEKEGSDTVELDQARVGRLSRMDALQGQAMSQETQRRRKLQLKDISAALGRMDEGMYGECVECCETVNIDRLRINPAASLCITCASVAERES